jgi:glycosyltransferase involved in cell wall biosynthesis
VRKIKNTISGSSMPFNKKLITDFISASYDAIFSNTITNGYILEAINPKNVKVISYVHELENSIRMFVTKDSLFYTLRHTTEFLVPSVPVYKNLLANHHINSDKIFYLNYYVPEIDVPEERIAGIREALNLLDCLVVGCIGSCEWRKGPDLFLQVGVHLKNLRHQKKVKLVWIGADKSSPDFALMHNDAFRAGVLNDVIILGSVSNPIDYLAVFDIFILTSREDPYPLVILEAAMQKKPVLAFENSGGVTDFLLAINSEPVPYLDTYSMALRVEALLADPEARQCLGEIANEYYKKSILRNPHCRR